AAHVAITQRRQGIRRFRRSRHLRARLRGGRWCLRRRPVPVVEGDGHPVLGGRAGRSGRRAPGRHRPRHRHGRQRPPRVGDRMGPAHADPPEFDQPRHESLGETMDFELPEELAAYLEELDAFIEAEIVPLEQTGDNVKFFDHRREDARTDWERGGLPTEEWEALLAEARRRADAAGHYRYAFPKEYGGRHGINLGMAVIREHLARRGLGLHCDLQNEHAIVANNVGLLLMLEYGSDEQKATWVDGLAEGTKFFAF